MIIVKDSPYPYGCNACRDSKCTKQVEFRSAPEAGGGIMIELCEDCIEELKGALK